MTRVLVTGAGGFIGGHLVGHLLRHGYDVRAVDVKPVYDWWQLHPEAENVRHDLNYLSDCARVVHHIDWVFHLAADMGGRGYISDNPAACMLSVAPTAHMLDVSARSGVSRFFYASSACVYSGSLQEREEARPLREETDVYPAMPDDEYGWEKLLSERMTLAFGRGALGSRVARYHGIFGPLGSWNDGREKAPAALCRKVALAQLAGTKDVEVWGDGRQTRTFLYVDEAAEATRLLMAGIYDQPVNIGSATLISMRELVQVIGDIAGLRVRVRPVPGPQGPRGRSSDNTLIGEQLDWQPASDQMVRGLEQTYAWIWDQVRK